MRGGVERLDVQGELRAAVRLALSFGVAKLLLQFALTLWTSHLGYSYFRDEFYYIVCGRHLAWGYVDHGPLVALQARVGEWLFGDSVFGIRVLSAVAGALVVFLTGLIAWVLGGRRPAQALAMLAMIVCPQYIGIDGFLSMNSWEPVFWMLCVLALLLLSQGQSPKLWWPVLGVSAGVGLLNKPSMLFFLLAVLGGLLLTPARRVLRSRWFAVGLLLMLLIPVPYVLWQQAHHWPMLEFLHNDRVGHKNRILNPLQFFVVQWSNMQPLGGLVWIPGVVALLRQRSIPGARWLGLAVALFFVGMYALHAKDYYLAPIYPAFFAAGGVAWERVFAQSARVKAGRLLAFPVYEGLLVATTLVILPMASPVLRPATWVRYTDALHLHNSRTETAETGPLPQFYADRFGWEQEVGLVRQAFGSLSPADQRRVCLFGGNYGEAGAIDFLGHLGKPAQATPLPAAISGHNNYWLWGTHDCDPEVVIAVVSDSPEALGKKYRFVEVVGRLDSPWAMPFEHENVYLLRGRRASAPFRWAQERYYF